jgi:hypothetical protein
MDDRANKKRKGRKMRELNLTDAEKIKILERVKERLQDYRNTNKRCCYGLCNFLKKEFESKMETSIGCSYFADMKEIWFRDFTFENANLYANASWFDVDGDYWWRPNPYDYENRILFLDWMINRIKTGEEGRWEN